MAPSVEPNGIPEPTPVIRPAIGGMRDTETQGETRTQFAPPVPSIPDPQKRSFPRVAKSEADREAEELAAEVAAILAEDAGEIPRDLSELRAPRPLIVKLPSEKYLTEATKELQSLPMADRPSAFQAMIEKYRAMRNAERESMRKR